MKSLLTLLNDMPAIGETWVAIRDPIHIVEIRGVGSGKRYISYAYKHRLYTANTEVFLARYRLQYT